MLHLQAESQGIGTFYATRPAAQRLATHANPELLAQPTRPQRATDAGTPTVAAARGSAATGGGPPPALRAMTFWAQRRSASYCFLLSLRRLGPKPSSSPSLPLSESSAIVPPHVPVARLLVTDRGVHSTMPSRLRGPPAPLSADIGRGLAAVPRIALPGGAATDEAVDRPPVGTAAEARCVDTLAVGEHPAFVRMETDRGPLSEIVLGALTMR